MTADVIRTGKETAENRQAIKRSGRQSPAPALTNRWGLAVSTGEPAPLALAEWLGELALYGNARSPLHLEIAHQLSLAIENWYLRASSRFLFKPVTPRRCALAECHPAALFAIIPAILRISKVALSIGPSRLL